MPGNDTFGTGTNPAEPSWQVGLVAPRDWNAILPELLLSWSDDERQSQLDRLIAAAEALAFDQFRLYATTRADQFGTPQFGAAMLVEILPGHAANTWPAAVLPAIAADETQTAIHLRMLGEQILVQLQSEQIPYLQSLIAEDQPLHAARLATAGLKCAGRLAFFGATTEAPKLLETPEDLASNLQLMSASQLSDGAFAALVKQTYVGSLDTPLVDGLRDVRDVLAGYRAVGTSGDQHWYVARDSQGEVGCLLLAEHAAAAQMELVYLGIVPTARGRRYGDELARSAKRIAREQGFSIVVLAVDLANDPAIGVYARCGFSQLTTRSLWILSS